MNLRMSIVAGCLLAVASQAALAQAQTSTEPLALTETTCVSSALAASIPPSQIGEPVSAVAIDSQAWVEAAGNMPAYCMINGHLEPVDRSATARPILFGVALPAVWYRRAIQMGGGGMNGSIPALAGGFGGPSELARGFVTYGSDSGHANGDEQWTLNDEAIMNLGFMQMKKTHDVAMVLIERAYGERPAYNYYVGGSQGGREGLTVAQRYPDDYDGVLATVPIVGFSTLMLAPTLTRIQERALANWVPPVKGNAILAEFMRRCDDLDGRVDGIINDYYDCRAIFNVHDGIGEDDPWAAKRCANDVDPNPADSSAAACLTSGQIETLQFVFSNYSPLGSLPNRRTNFGMWAPTTAVAGAGGGFGPPPGPGAAPPGRGPATAGRGAPVPGRGDAPAGRGQFPPARGVGPGGAGVPGGRGIPGGRGAPGVPGGAPGGRGGIAPMAPPGALFVGQRYRGQEGAAPDAPVFATLGSNGVTGFMLQDVDGNPLDFDSARERDRREQVAGWLDSTDPDLRAFRRRGGKLIVAVGTDDTIAPSGEQLNYYQSVIDRMGRRAVDEFARFYVIPQTGHGLTGRSAPIDGNGASVAPTPIPSNFDRFALLQNWVENGVAPGKTERVTGPAGSLPLCSYPEYPRYRSGSPTDAASYACAEPTALK